MIESLKYFDDRSLRNKLGSNASVSKFEGSSTSYYKSITIQNEVPKHKNLVENNRLDIKNDGFSMKDSIDSPNRVSRMNISSLTGMKPNLYLDAIMSKKRKRENDQKKLDSNSEKMMTESRDTGPIDDDFSERLVNSDSPFGIIEGLKSISSEKISESSNSVNALETPINHETKSLSNFNELKNPSALKVYTPSQFSEIMHASLFAFDVKASEILRQNDKGSETSQSCISKSSKISTRQELSTDKSKNINNSNFSGKSFNQKLSSDSPLDKLRQMNTSKPETFRCNPFLKDDILKKISYASPIDLQEPLIEIPEVSNSASSRYMSFDDEGIVIKGYNSIDMCRSNFTENDLNSLSNNFKRNEI